MPRIRCLAAAAIFTVAAICGAQTAAPTLTNDLASFKSPATEIEKKGIDYLLAHQDPSGAWIPQVGPAITAMCVRALVQNGKPMSDPAVAKGLAFVETFRQKDGGYYKESNPNYNSAIVLSMFATLQQTVMAAKEWGNGPPPYAAQIAGLQNFLKSLQMDETKDTEGKTITANAAGAKHIDKDNPWYGGSGYGEDRPDLSNTSYMIEALHDSGLPASDPAIQKALVFVSRSQMNGETNAQPFAKKATDGGFIYTPVNGGESKFGDIDSLEGDSMLRSYGSMTYSGFKSLLYAGLTQDDPRVKAAVRWIQNNWTLEYNPGSASMDGQFYFFHAFAKAMHAWDHDTITDNKGVKHDWRKELTEALKQSQAADGSWVNAKSPRWLEGNPALTTAYGVLCLQEVRK